MLPTLALLRPQNIANPQNIRQIVLFRGKELNDGMIDISDDFPAILILAFRVKHAKLVCCLLVQGLIDNFERHHPLVVFPFVEVGLLDVDDCPENIRNLVLSWNRV